MYPWSRTPDEGGDVSALWWGPTDLSANKHWLDGQSHEETEREIDDCLTTESLIQRTDRSWPIWPSGKYEQHMLKLNHMLIRKYSKRNVNCQMYRKLPLIFNETVQTIVTKKTGVIEAKTMHWDLKIAMIIKLYDNSKVFESVMRWMTTKKQSMVFNTEEKIV